MDSKRIIDALTAHIPPFTTPQFPHHAPNTIIPNPQQQLQGPRSSILKWFSSLTFYHRFAALTNVDHSFVKMLNHLSKRGAGPFILLPDLQSDEDRLPSLCYRKVEGLFCRVRERDEAERLIWEGIRLFQSREGEKVEECSCSVRRLDRVTFMEEIVEDVERFVELMDSVSDGGFLRDEVEGGLSWLKGKGYYGIEAFVVNKMEVSLRLAWLGYCGGNRRGVIVVGIEGGCGWCVGECYWRRKGFVDWWERLDVAVKKDMLIAILGRNASRMAENIVGSSPTAIEYQHC